MLPQRNNSKNYRYLASSFSTLTNEEFKQLACKVNEQYHQSMTNLYTGLCEIHELYKSFGEQSDVLQGHYTRKTAEIKALEDVIGWQTNIRDIPREIPIMDKVRDNKIRVIIETWGSFCDAVGSIIQDGQEACKHRWTTSEVLLGFLGFLCQNPSKKHLPPS